MKAIKLAVGLALAIGLVGFTGCKKSGAQADQTPPMVVEGVSVDLPKLLQALETATPEQQSSARQIQMGLRYRQLDKALMEGEKLANDATLNEQQKKIATDVCEQLKTVAEKAPPSPPAQ